MKQTILIIEDEIIIAKNIQLQLNTIGYKTELATNCQDAIELSNSIEFDLVLSDINLKQETDGIDLIAKLRLKKSAPVIFLTAYNDTTTINRAELVQPYSFLIKPFHKEQLFLTIKMSLLHSKKQFLHNKNPTENPMTENLTKREIEIVKLMSMSKASEEIAEELNISPLTVATHRKNIYRKTNTHTIIDLVSLAIEKSWL